MKNRLRTGWGNFVFGLATLGAILGLSGAAWAQAPGVPGGELGYNAAMAKLFADIPYFTANVETALTNLTDKSRLTVPMKMYKHQDLIRLEVDFVKLKGSGIVLQGLSAMQNIGMARMTSLVDPKTNGMRVLFPDLKAHARVTTSEVNMPDPNFKVTKKAQGKETIAGQPCVRQQVTMTSGDGEKVEATTWEATALSNFPVRMMFKQKQGSMVMTYSGVVLAPPGDDLFKVPLDYKEFDSMSSLMQEAMTRAITGPGR